MSALRLTPTERNQAVDHLVDRVLRTRLECGQRYPLFAVPAGGPWTTSRRGSWCAGTWIGLLRIAAAHSGDTSTARDALDRARSLAHWVDTDTVFRAMVVHCATDPADAPDAVANDSTVTRLRQQCARSLTSAYSPALGAIPDGTELGRGAVGSRTCTVDATAAVIELLTTAPQVPGASSVAHRHTQTLLGCLLPDGRVHPERQMRVDRLGTNPVGRPGSWARGQAWALLGAAAAVRAWGDAWLTPARALAAHWMALPVPPPDIRGQTGPIDTAATAIAADALRVLAGADPQHATAHQAAVHRLCATLARTYLTGTTPRSVPATPPGVLTHSCYRTGPRGRQQVECVWGEYHLLRALAGVDDTTTKAGTRRRSAIPRERRDDR
jgi:unsaturated chondroitin disaccharide hydrolase